MKSKKSLIMKVIAIIFVLSVIITFAINTVIANNVISSMADVRVEINDKMFEEYELIGEQIEVISNDGLKINAYIFPNNHSKGNVLILHGMHGMDASSLFDYAKFIYDAGFTPVNIDMRAHGKSEGESLSFGYNEVYDVDAVITYLKEDQRFKEVPIILYGLSMGGSTAINTAAKSEHVDGVIAVSPFLSIQNQVADYMARDGMPAIFIKVFQPSVNLVLSHKFGVSPKKETPENAISNLPNMPILIIHGDADTQTAVYQAKSLYESSSSDKTEIWIVEGKDHLIVEDVLDDKSEFYREKIISFLELIQAKSNR